MSLALAQACQAQAAACAKLDSPFMARLMRLLAKHAQTHDQLKTWPNAFEGDLGPSQVSLPLRIAGGLHYLLRSGQDTQLAEVYPPHTPSEDALWAAVDHALTAHSDFWAGWLQNAPQTNEVRRSAALIAATHYLAHAVPMPIHLSELGASAGLNLMFDQFQMTVDDRVFGPDSNVKLTPDWTGDIPDPTQVVIKNRCGVDLNPLNAQDPDVQLRLLSYLWADQPHRAVLTKAAIALQDAPVDQADAISWLENRLDTPVDGLHLIYHTIAWQYFPKDAQKRGTALIEAAGARATPDAPLAWLRMEIDDHRPGAGLSVRLWPGNITLSLGRVDFHGRWIDWRAPKRLDLPW